MLFVILYTFPSSFHCLLSLRSVFSVHCAIMQATVFCCYCSMLLFVFIHVWNEKFVMERATHRDDKRAYSLQFKAGSWERLRCISIVTLNFQMESYGAKDVVLMKWLGQKSRCWQYGQHCLLHTHTHYHDKCELDSILFKFAASACSSSNGKTIPCTQMLSLSIFSHSSNDNNCDKQSSIVNKIPR